MARGCLGRDLGRMGRAKVYSAANLGCVFEVEWPFRQPFRESFFSFWPMPGLSLGRKRALAGAGMLLLQSITTASKGKPKIQQYLSEEWQMYLFGCLHLPQELRQAMLVSDAVFNDRLHKLRGSWPAIPPQPRIYERLGLLAARG
jgi:hypothetical protein